MNKITLLNLISACIIAYFVYTKQMDNHNYYVITLALLGLVVILNVYHLWAVSMDHFGGSSGNKVIINIPENKQEFYYIHPKDTVVWRNVGDEEVMIMGDVFGSVKLAPGDIFTFTYDCAGTYQFYDGYSSSVKHIIVG